MTGKEPEMYERVLAAVARLSGPIGRWVGPTKVAQAMWQGDPDKKVAARHSSWSSPYLKRLVVAGYADRACPGLYRPTAAGLAHLRNRGVEGWWMECPK